MAKKGAPKGQRRRVEHRVYLPEDEGYYKEVKVSNVNALRQGKLYDDFCVLNQEFLKYLLSLPLTKNDYRILMFLLSYMDKENRIIVDAEMIEHNLGISKTHVNKHITKLEKQKVIYKRNLGYRKGQELLINFDIISPHMSFKNNNGFEAVNHHKQLMRIDPPYMKQRNIEGGVDYINQDGEVFHSTRGNEDSPKKQLPYNIEGFESE